MDKTRVLLIGLGNFGGSWARNIIPACSDVCEFAAAVDLVEENLKKAPAGVPVYTDIDRALSEIHPDLVINVTPPNAHTDLNIRLMELGYPVICEKPAAGSPEDADRMERYYLEHGGFLAIMDDYRYSPVFRKAKEVLNSGKYGPIHTVNTNFRHYHPDYSRFYHGRLSQPLLLDVSIHHLDVCRYLTGAEPETTYCETFGAPYAWYGSRPANAVIHSHMTNGVFFTYFGTLAAHAGTTVWNADWEIECDKGTLKISGNRLYVYEDHEGDAREIEFEDAGNASREPMLRSILSAFTAGDKCESDFTDNIRTYRWLSAAIESSERHAEVKN